MRNTLNDDIVSSMTLKLTPMPSYSMEEEKKLRSLLTSEHNNAPRRSFPRSNT